MKKSKWHDITPETGNPEDLPIRSACYCVTREGWLDTVSLYWHPWTQEWRDGEGCPFGDVIAWREMPKAYKLLSNECKDIGRKYVNETTLKASRPNARVYDVGATCLVIDPDTVALLLGNNLERVVAISDTGLHLRITTEVLDDD